MQLYEKSQPELKLFQPRLKCSSLKEIENLMKVRRLNRERGKNKLKKRWLQSTKG